MKTTNLYNQIACPKCGTHPKKKFITEECSQYPKHNCKKLKEYLADQSNGAKNITDPCMDCQHNQITEEPETFLEIQTIFHKDGTFQFEETHQCHQCGSIYKFFNTTKKIKG